MEPPAAFVRATLVAEADELAPLLIGVRDDDAALTGRDLLVRVEAEDGRRAVRPDRLPLVGGAERFGRVLDQQQAVTRSDRAELVELARIPNMSTATIAFVRFVIAASTAAGSMFSVWGSTSANTGVPPSRMKQLAEATNEIGDVITSSPADARDSTEQVEAGRAARQGDGIRGADALGDHRLEAVDHRAEREPTRPEHLEHELLFPLAEIRPRQGDGRF